VKNVALILIDTVDTAVLGSARRLAEQALNVNISVHGPLPCHVAPNPTRGQLQADLVLASCVSSYRSHEHYAVGLVGRDLYVPNLNFVFGLAEPNLGCAVVSWHRLRGPIELFTQRLAKEVVHEVGHLQGLGHCSDPNCVMWFSNTLAETDRKDIVFCSRCAIRISEA